MVVAHVRVGFLAMPWRRNQRPTNQRRDSFHQILERTKRAAVVRYTKMIVDCERREEINQMYSITSMYIKRITKCHSHMSISRTGRASRISRRKHGGPSLICERKGVKCIDTDAAIVSFKKKRKMLNYSNEDLERKKNARFFFEVTYLQRHT